MIVKLIINKCWVEEKGGAGTIHRSIDFVNQSPWYIITWLYNGASAALAAWYLWQLLTFLLLVLVVCVGHIMRAPLVCLLSSPRSSEVANLDYLCSRLKKLLSACSVLIRFQHYFPTRFLLPSRPPPPPFLLFGRVGGWLGERGFFLIYLPNNKLCPCYLLEQCVKTCLFFRIFFLFFGEPFSGKKEKFDRFFFHPKK
jgi:hypothetical protein